MSRLKSLKEKLSGYGIDLFTLGYPINLSRGEKIGKNVCNDMCQVKILGKEKLNEFVRQRLINGKVWLLDTVKKNGIESERNQKLKLLQLFKVVKHLDISLTYP